MVKEPYGTMARGATIARTKTNSTTRATPPTGLARSAALRRTQTGCGTIRSTVPDARIHKAVADIDHQATHGHHERQQQHDTLDDGIIPPQDRIAEQPSDSGVAEDRFHG